MAQSHTPTQETKGVHVSPVDETWAMLSPAQGQTPPKERAMGSGTLTVALQANFYYPASIRLTMGLGGLNVACKSGETSGAKAEGASLLPQGRQLPTTDLSMERSFTFEGCINHGFLLCTFSALAFSGFAGPGGTAPPRVS